MIKLTKQYTPHDRYADSGVAWLGQVPEGWEVLKLKFLSSINPSNIDKKSSEYEREVLLCNYVDVYKNEFITGDLKFMKATAKPEQIRKFALQRGDVIITKDSETADDIAVPALVKNDLNNVLCGYHLALIRSNKNKILGDYLFRLFQSKKLKDNLSIYANGITRFGLSTFPINNIEISIPPLPTQQRIATYLDEKTEKIDKIIAGKKRLVELLEEKRKSVISEAVEGVGVGVKREKLKFVSSINRATLPETTNPNLSINYIDIGNVNNKGKIIGKEVVNFSDSPSRARRIVQDDDVIIATVRTYLKAIAYFEKPEENNIVSTGFAVLTPSKKVLGKYLYYKILSKRFVDLVVANSTGVSYPAINPTQLGNLFLKYPNIEHQKKIVDETDRKTQEIEKVIKNVKQSIQLLTEYKSSLISHVVTGRVKV
jgi:type I restriction enzyme S subunit